jgi:hypothetical protein
MYVTFYLRIKVVTLIYNNCNSICNNLNKTIKNENQDICPLHYYTDVYIYIYILY